MHACGSQRMTLYGVRALCVAWQAEVLLESFLQDVDTLLGRWQLVRQNIEATEVRGEEGVVGTGEEEDRGGEEGGSCWGMHTSLHLRA